MQLSIAHDFLPRRPSLAVGMVMDYFGVGGEQGRHVVADSIELDVRQGDVAYFVGPSGSGKSSLLCAAAAELVRLHGDTAVIWIDRLDLPDLPLVDALPLPISSALEVLTACGLGEARLMLRTPAELSDGQRCRFRLALGLAQASKRALPLWLAADEFSAVLDRTLARVVAFNLRRQADRTGVGFLLAAAHDDVLDDLAADLLVRCELDQPPRVERQLPPTNRRISFADEISYAEGTAADWRLFSGWHYRGHRLTALRRVTVMRHGGRPIGICVFTAPAASLRLRNRYFGLDPCGDRPLFLKQLNRQIWLLARVVLHPTYRGAGLAAGFVRWSCTTCPVPWIETLSALGHVTPLFERAGFVRVGVCGLGTKRQTARCSSAGIYARPGRLSSEHLRKSRFCQPVYYVFDNRRKGGRRRPWQSMQARNEYLTTTRNEGNASG